MDSRIVNLGCHSNKDQIPQMREFTNLFQVMFQSPQQFVFDEAKLLTTAQNLKIPHGDCYFVCHGPYWYNIQAPNRWLTQSRKSIIQHMNVCAQTGVKYFIIHPGTRKITDKKTEQVTVYTPEQSFECLTQTILGFLPAFTGRGVKLLLENTPSTGEKGVSPKAILDVVEWFKTRGLGDLIGLCFDTEHAYANGTPYEEFETYLSAADVIHMNSVPARVKFGEGLDRHTETPLYESAGIQVEQLVKWIAAYPSKVKILEMDTETALATFKWLSSGTLSRILG